MAQDNFWEWSDSGLNMYDPEWDRFWQSTLAHERDNWDRCDDLSFILLDLPGTGTTPRDLFFYHRGRFAGSLSTLGLSLVSTGNGSYAWPNSAGRAGPGLVHVTYSYCRPEDQSHADCAGRLYLDLLWRDGRVYLSNFP